MNSRPNPRGQSANDHSNDISYCAVPPLDPENRATSLWDYKKVCVAGTFNDPSDAFNYMYHYHLQVVTIACTSTTKAEQMKQKPKTKSSTSHTMSP